MALRALVGRLAAHLPELDGPPPTQLAAAGGGSVGPKTETKRKLVTLLQDVEQGATEGTGHRAACDRAKLRACLEAWEQDFLPRIGCPWPLLRRWLRPCPDPATERMAERIIATSGVDEIIAGLDPELSDWAGRLRQNAVARCAAAIAATWGGGRRRLALQLLSGMPTKTWLLGWILLGAIAVFGIRTGWVSGWTGWLLSAEAAFFLLWSRGYGAWGRGMFGNALRAVPRDLERPQLNDEAEQAMTFLITSDLIVIILYLLFSGRVSGDGGGGNRQAVDRPLRVSRWTKMPRTAWAGAGA
jgi:hypothetical protein